MFFFFPTLTHSLTHSPDRSVFLPNESSNRYTSEALTEDTALWPVWKTTSDSISVLDAGVVEGICNAEQNTIRVLEDNGLCRDCNGGNAQCMPTYSLVLFARLIVGDTSLSLSCAELASAWQSNKDETTGTLQQCTGDVIDQGHFDTIPSTCPLLFTPALVDEFFGPSEPLSRYTSSIFRTKNDGKGMYDVATEFDQGSSTSLVEGAYDTQDEDFINRYVEGVVNQDMSLALGSAIITTLAIILHTKSCWLTTIGLMQIILSFPLAFFVYHFVGRIEFFPFLNFLGVFVVFALGADDVFVAVDKWKNARLANPDATVEDIAASALPDAAGAMFLTTVSVHRTPIVKKKEEKEGRWLLLLLLYAVLSPFFFTTFEPHCMHLSLLSLCCLLSLLSTLFSLCTVIS